MTVRKNSRIPSLPAGLRAELARGEAVDCTTIELSDDLHVVVVGFVKDGTPDEALLDMLREYQNFVGKVEALD